MKRKNYSLIFLGILFTCNVLSQNLNDFKPYRLIVKFDNEIFKSSTEFTNVQNIQSDRIKEIMELYNVKTLQAVFRNRYDDNGNLKNTNITSSEQFSDLNCWQEIIIPDFNHSEEVVNILNNEKGIQTAYIEYPVFVKPSIAPNDAQYLNQWHLNSLVNPNSDIRAENAWDINRGRNDVIIAICDGGVDYNHIDLDPGDRSRVIAGYDSGDDDNDPMDDLPSSSDQSFAGHGTNVAGVIGAITDNENQVAGVMWNCRLMPVKMVGSGEIKFPFTGTLWDFSTTAFPSDVADAIDYSVNNGANVINLSYGFKDMGTPINEVILRVPLLAEAIVNAYNNNVVTVVAMGNEYNDGNPTNYPAAFSHEVIAVGATDNNSNKAGFSSTGSHINLSAPGTFIWTTERGGNTNNPSGTSFSAPIVSGVSGLVISQGLDRDLDLTNDDVRHILEVTSDDIIQYGIGFDEFTGYGKVNAFNALTLINEPNMLYHYSSFSGSTSKTNLDKWNYIGNRWGLSSGLYLDVDRYEVTRHITFEIPFCDVPLVWLRDRECVSMSFASPNDGFPWADITNVSTTGFDIRYAVYYVRKNSLGQTINKWVPSSLESSKIEYTVVGPPNPAGNSGPIIGGSIVCTSNSTFILQNVPNGSTITWSNSSNLLYVNGQNTSTYVVKAKNSSVKGIGWVRAAVNTGCEDFIVEKTFWVGKPDFYLEGDTRIGVREMGIASIEYASTPYQGISNVQWTCDGAIASVTGSNVIGKFRAGSRSGFGSVYANATNMCGSFENRLLVEVIDNWYKVYPNPVDNVLTIEFDYSKVINQQLNDNDNLEIEIYDKTNTCVYQTSLNKSINKIEIDLTNYIPDIYILKLKLANSEYEEKIILK